MSHVTESDRSAVTKTASEVSVIDLLRPFLTTRRDAAGAPDSRFEQIIQLVPVAICVCDAKGRITFQNRRASELWTTKADLDAAENIACSFVGEPSTPPGSRTPFEAAILEGKSARDTEFTLSRRDGTRFDASVTIEPIRDAGGQIEGAIVVVVDISERKRRDRHAALLSRMTDRLAGATTEGDIVDISTQLVGEHLGVQRCGFVENEPASGILKVISGWLRDPLPTLAGRHEVRALGDDEWQRSLGSALIAIEDVTTHEHTRTFAENYRVRGVRAYAGAPFVRRGEWIATLTVTLDEPRRWLPDELILLEHVVARVWPLIERARAQAVLHLITVNAPVGIFQTDAAGDCVFVNEQWCRMAGTSMRESRGLGWMRAIHPDDRQRVLSEWMSALGEVRPFSCEYRLLRTDGVVIWVQVSAIEYHDGSGRAGGYIGTVADVTERKAGEFALRESEKRFRLVASRAPVGIFMADPPGDTVFVNASWCALAGLSGEEAQGKGWIGAIHPEDRPAVLADWQEAVRRGVSSKAEFRFLHRDGAITWVHGTAVQLRDSTGRLTGYIGTVVDFTERKQAELALRESEVRFRLLADNIAQFAWICDASGSIVWINQRFSDYSGLSVEQLNGNAPGIPHHPEYAERVTEKFRQHVASGESWEDSFPLRGRDGTYRWFLSRAIPVRDEAGRITRWFGTNTDITDLRETQEMLRKAQEELLAHTSDLEQKIEARTASLREAIVQMEEFSYSVSHDLRAPLRAMNGYAEALIEDYGPQLDETARDYLARIRMSSERMEKLTHDVLSYSRLARADITMTSIDLSSLLRDLMGQYAELQPAAADLTIEQPLHRVRGHEISLGQCLGNLLTNAAKFVAPGTKPRIRVWTVEHSGMVRISVADNGIGIRPEHQRNLFQMFERAPTRQPYEGTGVGLAIVRKAVEKMGGHYGLDSDGTKGSVFWIELPKG